MNQLSSLQKFTGQIDKKFKFWVSHKVRSPPIARGKFHPFDQKKVTCPKPVSAD